MPRCARLAREMSSSSTNDEKEHATDPMLSTGFSSVERPFQGISVDLVEYKPVSTLATGIEFRYVLSIYEPSRFVALLPAR